MKELKFSDEFITKVSQIKKRDRRLFLKINKQLELFQKNPKHPSLRLHKLQGNFSQVWSISVTRDFRILFSIKDMYYFFDLGTHADIYQRN